MPLCVHYCAQSNECWPVTLRAVLYPLTRGRISALGRYVPREGDKPWHKHDMTHVEVWMGDGKKTLGARWARGVVEIHDTYEVRPPPTLWSACHSYLSTRSSVERVPGTASHPSARLDARMPRLP